MHEIGLLACYAQSASFIPRVRVDQSLLTPALEWRMISRHCRKMVPNPLKHLLALLDPRQSRWVDGRNCQNIFLRKLVVSSHVPFSSQLKIPHMLRASPDLMIKISPNFISVPCDSATAFRSLSLIEPVLKGSYSMPFARRQRWKSSKIPRPTIPFSVQAAPHQH
jgi:hypothetical protein